MRAKLEALCWPLKGRLTSRLTGFCWEFPHEHESIACKQQPKLLAPRQVGKICSNKTGQLLVHLCPQGETAGQRSTLPRIHSIKDPCFRAVAISLGPPGIHSVANKHRVDPEDPAESKLKVLVAHPGGSATNLGTTTAADGGVSQWLIDFLMPIIAQTGQHRINHKHS